MTSTSNATRQTKKVNGAPNHKVLYDNLQVEIAVVRKELSARKASEKSLHAEIYHLGNRIKVKDDYIEILHVEASRNEDNIKERNHYRTSARGWAVCSVTMLIGILAVAVWV